MDDNADTTVAKLEAEDGGEGKVREQEADGTRDELKEFEQVCLGHHQHITIDKPLFLFGRSLHNILFEEEEEKVKKSPKNVFLPTSAHPRTFRDNKISPP